MSSRPQFNERDLRDLAEALFTSPRPSVTPRAAGFSALPTVTCGDPLAAPLLALALAALPSGTEKTLVVHSGDQAPAWGRSLVAGELKDLEQPGTLILVVLPPRDGPVVRTLAMAVPRHLVYIAAGDGALPDLRTYLLALDMAAQGGEVVWLCAPGSCREEAALILDGWAKGRPGRREWPLGQWAPGLAFPAGTLEILAQDGAPPGTWNWAWSLIAHPQSGKPSGRRSPGPAGTTLPGAPPGR